MNTCTRDREEEMEKQQILEEMSRQNEALQSSIDKCLQTLENVKEVLRDLPALAEKHSAALAPDPEVKRPTKPQTDA